MDGHGAIMLTVWVNLVNFPLRGAPMLLFTSKVEYALRAVDTGKFLQLTTEQRDGKVRVVVEANDSDADKTPLTNIKLKAGVMSPTFKGPDAQRLEIGFE